MNFSKGKEWEREQYAELLHRIYNKLYIKGYKVAVWSILSKISYSNLSSKDCDYDKIISRLHCHGSIVGYSLKDMNEVSEIIREETEEYYKNLLVNEKAFQHKIIEDSPRKLHRSFRLVLLFGGIL